MNKKTETLIFGMLAVNLLIIAVVGFTLDKHVPEGIIISTKAGGVKFNHLSHQQHGSPELTCEKCHHHIKDEQGKLHEPKEMECRECHYYGEVKVTRDTKNDKMVMAVDKSSPLCELKCEQDEVHKNCIGGQCVSCHKEQDCGYCHYQSY